MRPPWPRNCAWPWPSARPTPSSPRCRPPTMPRATSLRTAPPSKPMPTCRSIRTWPRWVSPLARALALVRHCELPRLLTITDDPEARREAFVWDCIKEMASAHPVADELPAIEALGALELGPFANRQFMSPMEIHQARHAQQVEAAEA